MCKANVRTLLPYLQGAESLEVQEDVNALAEPRIWGDMNSVSARFGGTYEANKGTHCTSPNT